MSSGCLRLSHPDGAPTPGRSTLHCQTRTAWSRKERPMKPTQVALYARVSSEQQNEARTIESQIADLRTRIAATGANLPAELEFVDNGYSGATLIRPALERLRDVAAAGGIDQLYVHCPDRLARNYAHQVLLLEEFFRAGVEVIFLNREVGQTPEDHLLLQVQGMISEYERAKIMERSRRGKRHGAQVGKVSVLSGAPYGYRYVSKQEGDGEARYEIVWEEARVVCAVRRFEISLSQTGGTGEKFLSYQLTQR